MRRCARDGRAADNNDPNTQTGKGEIPNVETQSFHLMALAMLLAGTALATELTLSDAPGTPTQAVVLSLEAVWLDEVRTPYDIQVLEPDALTMDTVTDIYTFVAEQGNRPARYFPEDVQQAIADMYDVDIDALYMTEFMRLHAAQAQPAADVEMTMLLDVDYQPGQLTAVVLGGRERSGEHRVARRAGERDGAGRGHERDPAGGDRADAGRGHPLQPADRAPGTARRRGFRAGAGERTRSAAEQDGV